MIETAKAILERGDAVLMFPEGTRTRPGALGKPKRGVGRLAIETGATVVPVAMIGTEAIRKGWRIGPHKIRVRIGAPLRFPKLETATTPLAAAVTDRIWPNVMLQWEWLGGLPPLRRAAVIGTGPLEHVALGRAHACRYRRGPLGGLTRLTRAFHRYDLVVFDVPASELPAVGRRARAPDLSTGPACSFAPPDSCRRSAHCPAATSANSSTHGRSARSAGSGGDVLEDDAAIVVASQNDAFSRQVQMAPRAAKLKATRTSDVTGTELASCAGTAAAVAAAAAAAAGPDAQDAAARQVLAELDAFARRTGSKRTGLGSTDELIGNAVARSNRFQRSDDTAGISLLAARVHEAGVDAPVLEGLVGIIEGRVEPGVWTSALDAEPPALKRAV